MSTAVPPSLALFTSLALSLILKVRRAYGSRTNPFFTFSLMYPFSFVEIAHSSFVTPAFASSIHKYALWRDCCRPISPHTRPSVTPGCLPGAVFRPEWFRTRPILSSDQHTHQITLIISCFPVFGNKPWGSEYLTRANPRECHFPPVSTFDLHMLFRNSYTSSRDFVSVEPFICVIVFSMHVILFSQLHTSPPHSHLALRAPT